MNNSNTITNNKEKLPTLSVVIVTFNNGQVLPPCLEAILVQDYPKEKIEYINIDGGSTDNTKELMKQYNFRVVDSPVANAEAQRAYGLREAKHEIVVYIDADNYLPHNQWFLQMTKPFIDDSSIIYSQTMRYTHRMTDSGFNRYCALFGVNDPVVYYVGRPDRLSWSEKRWRYGKIIKNTESYFVVNFTKENMPTIGCNGIMVRRDILFNHAQSDPEHFLHIDVYVDLLEKGFNNFAIVKNDVVHATAYTLRNLIKKRMAFLMYFYGQKVPRRYMIYDSTKRADNWRMFLFVIYTVTFVRPLVDSIVGYVKIRDVAWFIHPIACWAFLYAYGKSFIKNKLAVV